MRVFEGPWLLRRREALGPGVFAPQTTSRGRGGALPPDLVNGITGRQDLLSFHVSLVQVVGKGPSSGQIKPRAQTPPDRVDPQLCAPSQSAREP